MHPLEEYLQYNKNDKFPDKIDYFTRYSAIKQNLTEGIYKELQASASSKDGCFYTHHGLSHVDDVIEYSGYLLGIKNSELARKKSPLINAYEVYMLLVSILLHDAGMIDGRDNHEAKAKEILFEMGDLSGTDRIEKARIATIAKAHSGKSGDIPIDTIGAINTGDTVDYLGCTYRPKMLAAIVRFSDEICETKKRAARYSLSKGNIQKGNEVYHAYANCITSSKLDNLAKSIKIKYEISDNYLYEKVGKNSKEVYLIDEIRFRLEKMDTERQYCNRFFPVEIRIEKITAELQILDPNFEIRGVETYLVEDRGYPTSRTSLSTIYPDFTVQSFQRKYSRGKL